MSVNALNDISDYVASAENNNTFHKVITDVPGIVTYYTDGFENVTVDNFTAAMFSECLVGSEMCIRDSPIIPKTI